MVEPWERETAAQRLLYDDAAPRLRQPVNPTVLKFRRPAFLFIPLTVAVAAALPASFVAAALAAPSPDALPGVGAVFGGFFLFALTIALFLSRREEGSYALLTPNLVSVSHAALLLAFLSAILVPGLLASPPVAGVMAGLPGPTLPTPQLELLKAYCILFVLVTLASTAAALVLRLIGFRRVVAGSA